MDTDHDDLDRPIWGAEAIARQAGLIDDDGKVEVRRAFYLLEKGLLPATKVGGAWTSTPRRLRKAFSGEAA